MNYNSIGSKKISEVNVLFIIIFYTFIIALIIFMMELILRLKGVEPWQNDDVKISVTPGGKFFSNHPTLGYSHIPGTFNVHLKDGYSFKVTHLPNTLRITHPLITYSEDSKDRKKPELWIFGCSFTHGWALNDQETYPWLLQERFPQYEVVNFGVSGYGTIHSLIQFREALESRRIPKIAILAYASFHDERNVFSRNRRKQVAPWNKLGPIFQPYALIDQNDNLHYYFDNVAYHELPLMAHSALIHFIEAMYNKFDDWQRKGYQVSKALILEFAKTAQNNRINFLVAGISSDIKTHNLLSFLKNKGVSTVDISVDMNLKENINLPHDLHPSACANKKYADKLYQILRCNVVRDDNYQ